MRKFDPVKVLDFLNEVYAKTKKPKLIYLTPICRKHSISSNVKQAMIDKKIIRIVRQINKKDKIYEWIATTPPSIYIVNMLIFTMQEMNKEYQLEYQQKVRAKNQIQTKIDLRPSEENKIIYPADYAHHLEKKFAKRNCKWDGIEFTPTVKQQSFCSDECRKKYHRLKLLNPHLDIFKGEAIKKAKAIKEIESKEEINQNEEKLLNYDDIQNLFGHPLDEVVAVKKETEKIAEPEEMKIEKTKKGFSILWGAIKVNW